jgi:uncharacterized membrane protein YjjB (DUF3815 family)
MARIFITSCIQVLGKLFTYLPLAFRFFPGFGPVQVLHPWMFLCVVFNAQGNQVAWAVVASLVDFNAVMNVEYPRRDVSATFAATIVVTASDVFANDLHSPIFVITHARLHGKGK